MIQSAQGRTHDDLRDRLNQKASKIGILGMGYVGQPLALRFASVGYKVIGFDIDSDKVSMLNAGKTDIEHIGNSRIAEANELGMECTTEFSRSAEADALIICVPTPGPAFKKIKPSRSTGEFP